jgi:uncharacterized membrane protein YecN with MAPEG domain
MVFNLRGWSRLLAVWTDRFSDGPAISSGRRWIWGLVAAACLVAPGGLVLYYAIAYDKGLDWVAFGLMFVSPGLALHFYYLWAPSRRFRRAGMLATWLSLALLVLSIVYQILHVLL